MGNFKRAIKTQVGKGTKAMYDILKSREFHNRSISCQLELFDKVVKPINQISHMIMCVSQI
jgi:hypothetical protein